MRFISDGDGNFLFRKKISDAPLYLAFASVNTCDEAVNRILSNEEQSRYSRFKSEKAKKDYLSGRAAAKVALNGIFSKEMMFDYEISNGIFGEPVVDNAEVSISHSHGYAAAVASNSRLYFGIDIEYTSSSHTESIRSVMTKNERLLISGSNLELCVWTAKEAISKVFHTGLASNFCIYEIKRIEETNYGYTFSFSNFPQYKAHSFLFDKFRVTIAVPAKFNLDLKLENEL